MRYEDEDIEIIDAYEDIKTVSHVEKKEVKPQPEKQKKVITKKVNVIKQEQSNAILFYSIIFLPIFAFVYLISTHSNVLINERISIFSLIMTVVSSIPIKRHSPSQ